jgi:sialic acid synthase
VILKNRSKTGIIQLMKIPGLINHLLGRLPPRVKVGNRYIGSGEPVFVIAEIGINHNGDIELAKQLIDSAKKSGADAVKFQKRTTADILTKEGRDKPYTSPHAFAPTYGEHRDKLEFSEGQYQELKKHAEKAGVLFFASVWDETSADFLERLDIDAYKIPSADTINIPLLKTVAKKNKPVLLSTGMNSDQEITDAVKAVLDHNDRIIIFHCLSLYPSPEEKINLRYLDVLRQKFHPLPVGYSGHEKDYLPTLGAVARGACVIERHFTLDKTMKGSDHAASLEPMEFEAMVTDIRRMESILGKPERIMYEELTPLREKLAKSVATRVELKKGQVLTSDILTIKGPGTGIKPSQIKDLIGRIVQEDLKEDVLLPLESLSWPKK